MNQENNSLIDYIQNIDNSLDMLEAASSIEEEKADDFKEISALLISIRSQWLLDICNINDAKFHKNAQLIIIRNFRRILPILNSLPISDSKNINIMLNNINKTFTQYQNYCNNPKKIISDLGLNINYLLDRSSAELANRFY